MRVLLLIAGAALALSGCGKSDQKDNNQIVDENLTAQNIVSNDVTAIDAVTGDAANMAQDVDMNFGSIGDTSEAGQSSPSKSARGTSPKTAAPTTAETTNSSAGNSATNAQ